MDISQWYNVNEHINIVATKKKFYNRYLHKLVYQVYGATSIPYNKDVQDFFFKLSRFHDDVAHASIYEFYNVFHEKDQNLKFRIEGSTLAIFCEDINYLYSLASTRFKNAKPHTLSTILDQKQEILLEQGLIIVKTPTDHIWRVNLRSGLCKNLHERHGLAEYLVNLGQEVKITKKMLYDLKSTAKYFGGGYFHVKDPRLVDMIRLIVPNLVKSVNQLVVQ